MTAQNRQKSNAKKTPKKQNKKRQTKMANTTERTNEFPPDFKWRETEQKLTYFL